LFAEVPRGEAARPVAAQGAGSRSYLGRGNILILSRRRDGRCIRLLLRFEAALSPAGRFIVQGGNKIGGAYVDTLHVQRITFNDP
jgi:hypothetical protein